MQQRRLAGLLNDPLRSAPEALALGARPPGSTQPLVCLPTGALDAELSLRDAVHMALCANPKVQLAWIAIKTQANNLGASVLKLPSQSQCVCKAVE